MIRAIIVDDEKNSRENIHQLVDNFCENITVVGEAKSVSTGMEAIKKHHPDLVFLDIEMPGGDGFQLLENLSEINFEVIFITAYDKYAIKAFKANALDYLLKPVNILELKAAVEKVESRLKGRTQGATSMHKKLALPASDGYVFVQLDDIVRCEASDYYTFFFLTTGDKVLVSKTLKEYDEALSKSQFFRVHQSHLINIKHIKQYAKGGGGEFTMSDGSKIPVAQRKKEIVDVILSRL